MIDAVRSSAALLLNGIAARPDVWLGLLIVAAIGSAVLAFVRRRRTRRALLIVWALLPALTTGLWMVACNAGPTPEGEAGRCFAAGFAFAIALTALPVWAVGTLIGAMLGVRLRGLQ